MAKFDPYKFNYHLVEDNEMVLHYQKTIKVLNPEFTDVIELVYYKNSDSWVIMVKTYNIKHLLPDVYFNEDEPLILFCGKIKTEFDFEFIFNHILKNPYHLMMGS